MPVEGRSLYREEIHRWGDGVNGGMESVEGLNTEVDQWCQWREESVQGGNTQVKGFKRRDGACSEIRYRSGGMVPVEGRSRYREEIHRWMDGVNGGMEPVERLNTEVEEWCQW